MHWIFWASKENILNQLKDDALSGPVISFNKLIASFGMSLPNIFFSPNYACEIET